MWPFEFEYVLGFPWEDKNIQFPHVMIERWYMNGIFKKGLVWNYQFVYVIIYIYIYMNWKKSRTQMWLEFSPNFGFGNLAFFWAKKCNISMECYIYMFIFHIIFCWNFAPPKKTADWIGVWFFLPNWKQELFANRMDAVRLS
jgi:hypothetical protein